MKHYICPPSGKITDSGITSAEYIKRVQAAIDLYECDRSDAEGIVDCELLTELGAK